MACSQGFVFAKHNVQMFVLAECNFETSVRSTIPGHDRRTVGVGGAFYSDCISYLVQ